MMSLEDIREESSRAARKASKDHQVPFVFWPQEVNREALRNIPFLGKYLPLGWERMRLAREHGVYGGDNQGYGAWLVDSTGLGREGENALTVEEFLGRIQLDVGYGIVEAGQWQVKIGCYQRLKRTLKP